MTPFFKTSIIGIFLLFDAAIGKSQVFTTAGKITYERKIQIHKILETNTWAKDKLDNIPRFYTSTFELKFNKDSSYYYKVGDDDQNGFLWAVYARENEISTVFATQQSVAKKTIFQDAYFIKDSLPTYRWKLVNETRNIAGVECKKATTIINDSVFVVAFYAENVVVSGGPEQFSGLPGLILGVAIPRLHVSYYAKKVEASETTDIKFPKQKNKTMTRAEFHDMVMKNMKWAFSNSGIGALYLFL